MSRFRIVIRDTETGDDAVLVPGSTGERDLIRAVTDATVRQGVGMFRTEAQVKKAIDTAVREVLLDMKREVKSVRR
jgi:hypothetical protein